MLPAIESVSSSEWDEVPFRLPSRFQDRLRNKILSKSFMDNSNKRNYTQLRRAKTSFDVRFSMMDEQFDIVVNKYADKEFNKSSSSRLTGYPTDEFSRKSLRYQSKLCAFPRNLVPSPRDDEAVNLEKQIWISELRKWISENYSSTVEFMKVSKSATLYGSKMWKNLRFELAQSDLEACERFSSHFQRVKSNIKTDKKISHSHNDKSNKESERISISFQNTVAEKVVNGNMKTEIRPILKRNISLVKQFKTKSQKSIKIKSVALENSLPAESDQTGLVEEIYPISVLDTDAELNNGYETLNELVVSIQDHTTEENPTIVVDKNHEIEDQISELTLGDFDLAVTDNKFEDQTDEVFDSPMINLKRQIQEEYTEEQSEMLISENQSGFIKEIPVGVITSQDSVKSELQSTVSESTSKIKQVNQLRQRKNGQHRLRLNENENEETSVFEPILQIIIQSRNQSDTEAVSDTVSESETTEELTNVTILDSQPISVDLPSTYDETANPIKTERNKLAPLLKTETRKWGNKKRDLSLVNELQRERAAEERKLKIVKMNEKIKEKNKRESSLIIPEAPRFESYGFLAKYCILQKINVSLYRSTFDVCDEDKKQWLNNSELIMALKGVNANLRDYDLAYLNMVMKTCDYNLRHGADFKLFAVLAALSIQITTLDAWIRNSVGESDLKALEKKTYFCRKLWKVLVDPLTNTMPLSRLYVELRAGGVKEVHIEEVRERLGWMQELTLLDYFTYIPLFILMHTSIIDNPLDTSERI